MTMLMNLERKIDEKKLQQVFGLHGRKTKLLKIEEVFDGLVECGLSDATEASRYFFKGLLGNPVGDVEFREYCSGREVMYCLERIPRGIGRYFYS